MRKVVVYIAMSLDGYIATAEGDLSFLSLVEQEGEDYGYTEFIKTIDTVVVGRKTYDKIISMGVEFPYTGKKVFVISRIPRTNTSAVQYYNGSLRELITSLKSQKGQNIYCDGGAEIVNQLLREGLLDEVIVSIIPVLLGKGIRLFQGEGEELKLELITCRQFEKGLVQVHYKCL